MKQAFPEGHYYSPIVDFESLNQRKESIWPVSPRPMQGIDFQESAQQSFIVNEMRDAGTSFNYQDVDDGTGRYYLNNGLFGGHDALALVAMLRKYRPRKIIEIGSGYSSLLISSEIVKADSLCTDFLCVDPYPRPFIRQMQAGGALRLIESNVELLPVSVFAGLEKNDILFVDSSHVSKTGSDVNFLFFEVFPSLPSGVVVHIHDIFLPFEYPSGWVLETGICWNEQYILRALLTYSNAFDVIFGSAYAEHAYAEELIMAWGRKVNCGSSFWMVRK